MRALSIIALLLSLLSGCALNPVTGNADFVMMSESQELSLGRQADEQVKKQYQVYPSKALQDYVNGVGQKLAKKSHRPELQYHFLVLDSTEINAFALPGGYVYITRGIMAYLNSEAELAAVLGHEIGHVTSRHGVRQQSAAQATNIGLTIASIFVPQVNTMGGQNLSNLIGGALLSGYGRDHELEADRLGADYLARSEYNPQAIIKVIGVLKNQELQDAELAKQEGREPRRYHGLFASHPDNDTRLQQAVGEADKQTVNHPVEGHDEYLQATEGMVFNDNSDQGVLRNNAFYQATLGIGLQFPVDWQVHNLPKSLVAISPKGEAKLQMKLDEKPEGTPEEYAKRSADSNTVESLEINGLKAAIATRANKILAVIYLNDQAYLLQAEAKSEAELKPYQEVVLATIHSFHRLSGAEAKLAKPLELHMVRAQEGDTYRKLALSSPLGKSAENYLRLINAQYPAGEPKAGELIKIVE
ncbi:MAG: M48 family metalloprotease [Gallionella sp.]|nr:M48 family metalloprotease [Gallionella sp.]